MFLSRAPFVSAILVAGLWFGSSTLQAMDPSDLEFFEAKIRPVLVEHCHSCHSEKSKSIKGSLVLDSRKGWEKGGDSGAAIVPGKPEESLLLKALKYEDYEMPPKGKLSPQIIRDFEHWIRRGAVDPRKGGGGLTKKSIDYDKAQKFWAFQKPQTSPLPRVKATKWPQNELDHYVLAKLEAEKLKPNPSAPAGVLVRRIYFNLVGMPPTPQDVDRFQKSFAQNPQVAIKELVDHLLDSPHYGERWARHWLDVARYGEDQAHTFKARKYPRGYLYRDWVVKSFNEDLPYDEFIAYQIAGDLLPGPDRHERLAALGLFGLGPVYYAENVEKAKAAADEWDDRVDTLMRGVLGLTVSCARCHDHKYDPITMDDYYGLAGIFASTKYEERSVASPEQEAKRRTADQKYQAKVREADAMLARLAARLRSSQVEQLPAMLTACMDVLEKSAGDNKKRKKLITEVAKREKLSQTLIKRWLDLIQTPSRLQEVEARRWPQLKNLAKHVRDKRFADARIAAKELATSLKSQLQQLEAKRVPLQKDFGTDLAFVKAKDRAKVRSGVIPLGNLFDDSNSISLERAVSSDRFRAAATSDSLGVDRVLQGWGTTATIGAKIKFDFRKLGSDQGKHGSVVNDAWDTGGIRTEGKRGSPGSRAEQGIGMHANSLVTFDLAEIRSAGRLVPTQKLVLKVDRAGLNDDVFGQGRSSAHMAVIFSRPHRTANVTDAILGVWVNGQKMEVATNDFTYYIAGEIPPALKADGRFFSLTLDVPADARFLTLVTTGAGGPADNPINSDHTVFSGIRLEQDPLPGSIAAKQNEGRQVGLDKERRAQAVFLSRFYYDEGLFAIPAKEAEPMLPAKDRAAFDRIKQVAARLKKEAEAIQIDRAHAISEGGSRDLPIYLQGNPAKHGEVAERGLPAIFTGGAKAPFQPQGSGRLELAKAICSPDNPLTARVIVNRVWAAHFGQGLVRTPSNFGQLGERPTHPRLLDHLTSQFMAHGWSIKWLHRQILLSATFQQSSQLEPVKRERDPENRLLARFSRRRLEIEPWRDALLSVTGELDLKMGGPSLNLDDVNNRRRTFYGFISRHRLNELLRLFDFPDPNITSDRRTNTTVPLQQLFVLNSDFVSRRAKTLVERMERDVKSEEIRTRAKYLYRLLYARSADDAELEIAERFINQTTNDSTDKLSRWEQYALALLSANEFMYLD